MSSYLIAFFGPEGAVGCGLWAVKEGRRERERERR